MPRKAADPKYSALARRVTALEKVVAILLQAIEEEADAESEPMEDLSGNRTPRLTQPGKHEGL